MTTRATRRPPGLRPPAHLSPSPPVPQPGPVATPPEQAGRGGLDPVRYGDWESKGMAIDF